MDFVPSQVSKYNERRHKIIVEAIRGGNYRKTAAQLAGISMSTLNSWMRDGEESEDSQYHRLFIEVTAAEAEVEDEMVQKVREAALSGRPNTWQAAMTYLERKAPERWGRDMTIRVEGGENPIQVATHHLLGNPEQLAMVLGGLAELQRRPPELEAAEGEFEELPGVESG